MKTIIVFLLCATAAWAFPQVKDAVTCNSKACSVPACRCSDTNNPINDPNDPAPQLIAITISESVVQDPLLNYVGPLFFDRKNPDGEAVGLTFYVNHEYTDYSLVNDLYLRGYDIGDHSITKEPNQAYWRNASLKQLEDEFCGQKIILSTFANIPEEDIIGARVPQLQLEGDVTISAYVNCDLVYDNSWPALTTNRVLPYTLDYLTTQQCTASEKCPVDAHPGFWIAPITDIQDPSGVECNSLATCNVTGSADKFSTWLLDQVNKVKNNNRAPLILRLDSYWFDFTENSYDGFKKFLDQLASWPDVYMVSVADVLEWIKDPVPLSKYSSPVHDDRFADCLPVTCYLKNAKGQERNMGSCIRCPENYPWLGNPLGQ